MITKKLFVLSFIVLLFAFYTTQTKAQNIKSQTIISFSPQHLLIKGAQVSIELPTRVKNLRNVFSPTFYYANNASMMFSDSRYDMWGLQADVHRKIYLNGDSLSAGEYFSFGATGGYTSIKFETGDIQPIIRTGVNALLGTVISQGHFVADLYIGLGFRYAVVDTKTPMYGQISYYWIDHAYSGALMLVGVKIGGFIPKKH